MGLYDDLTDEALTAKIAELRAAYEQLATGGGVVVLAGEGRRIEYTRGNIEKLKALLDAAILEQDKRSNNGRPRGRAMGVRFQ